MSRSHPQNAFVTLLGPSGCGKTTLLRMLAGFEHAQHADDIVLRRPLDPRPQCRPTERPVNIDVPVLRACFRIMNVWGQHRLLGLKPARITRKAPRSRDPRRRHARDWCSSSRWPEAPSGIELSGGQQQRVALARSASARRRELLLLDEPLSALDLKLRRGMQVELKRLQRETGITFLLVTHDQEEALAMSDVIAVMQAGRIEQIGTPSDVWTRPRSRFVADFFGANVLEGRLAGPGARAAALRPEDVEVAPVRRDRWGANDRVRARRRPLLPRGRDGLRHRARRGRHAGRAARRPAAWPRRRRRRRLLVVHGRRRAAGGLSMRRDRTALLALPALLAILVFGLAPMGIALYDSLLTPDPYGGVTRPYTAASYLRFFYDRDLDDALAFDPTYLRIFARSGLEAVATTILCLVIGLPLAWYMATRSVRLRQLLVLLVTIPFWTNLLIRIYCWVLLLRDEGLVNQALQALHLTKAPITFLYSDGAILTGLVYSNLPFMALPDLRIFGEARPAPRRGRLRPFMRAAGQSCRASSGRSPGRGWRRVSRWSLCPPSAPSSRPTFWAAAAT